jgi:hypothetical protein
MGGLLGHEGLGGGGGSKSDASRSGRVKLNSDSLSNAFARCECSL